MLTLKMWFSKFVDYTKETWKIIKSWCFGLILRVIFVRNLRERAFNKTKSSRNIKKEGCSWYLFKTCLLSFLVMLPPLVLNLITTLVCNRFEVLFYFGQVPFSTNIKFFFLYSLMNGIDVAFDYTYTLSMFPHIKDMKTQIKLLTFGKNRPHFSTREEIKIKQSSKDRHVLWFFRWKQTLIEKK